MPIAMYRPRRISTKLLLGSLIIVGVSLIVLNLIWINYVIPQQKKNLSELQLNTAHRAADKIESFLEAESKHLHHFLEREYFLTIADEEKLKGFNLFIANNPEFEEMAFIDRDGNEIVKASKIRFFKPEEYTNLAETEMFSKTKEAHHYISPVHFRNAVPYVTMAASLVNPRQDVEGLIVGELNLSNLWDSLRAIKPSENGFAYIVGQDGVLIGHPDFSEVLKNQSVLNRQCVTRVLTKLEICSGSEPGDNYDNEKGEEVYAAGVPIKSLGWAAMTEAPISEATAPVNQIVTFSLIVIGITIFWVVVISILFSRNITSPIRELEKGAQIVGEGDLEYRLNIKTGDEIQQVSESFNNMATRLKESYSSLEEKVEKRTLDLKKANEELEKEKETISAERNKLEVIISGIKDAVIAIDLKRKVILFNNAAENVTGYKAEEVVGKEIEKVIKVFDEKTEVMSEVYSPIRTDGFEGVVFSKPGLKLLGKSNKESFANLISGQIKEGKRANLGAILTFHDITQEKQLEEMKLDFVSMAAHELRTPLTTIKGYLSVFLEENAKSFDKEQRMFLDRMSIATEQLVSLVENLLNVSRIERGVFSVNLEVLDWEPIVSKTVEELSERAKEKNIELKFVNPRNVIHKVQADKLRVGEIISNLVSNAISYTQSGGKVTVSTEVRGNDIITNVEDTGVGIPKEAQSHLFTKFFRVSGTLAQGSKGTGLGLYIAKAITEMHKGKIWVKSEVDKGSTFSFSLPLQSSYGTRKFKVKAKK